MEVNPAIIEGFVETYLRERYDEATDIPDCHRDWWEWYCATDQKGALAAPRSHAKSTAITEACTLCEALFGAASHFLIVSATEEQGKLFIGGIKQQLRENEDLKADFDVQPFIKDTETEIICRCKNGVFRMITKGAEQKLRGIKWNGKRPDRIVGDDIEEDEQVESKERRQKFRRWFQNALLPCMSRSGKVRIVGTVLHMDAMLERCLKSKLWLSIRAEAHNDDFSEILWPAMFPRERLLSIRSGFHEDGNLEGYNREYRNKPISDETAFFKKDWLIPMTTADVKFFDQRRARRFVVAVDCAVSKESYGDYAVFGVIGIEPDNSFDLVHVIRKRMDAMELMETFFTLHDDYNPDVFMGEKGVIEKVLEPMMKREMIRRGRYIHFEKIARTSDKRKEAQPIQRILRAGGMKFDKEASWWPDFEDEITRFDKVKHDDQVDMLATFGLCANSVIASDTDDEIAEDQYAVISAANDNDGRDAVCGY